jgi:hypothetical protein
MQHTTSHELSQWAETDRILREDFNSDNAKIEAALAGMLGRAQIIKSISLTVDTKVDLDLSDIDWNQWSAVGFILDIYIGGNYQAPGNIYCQTKTVQSVKQYCSQEDNGYIAVGTYMPFLLMFLPLRDAERKVTCVYLGTSSGVGFAECPFSELTGLQIGSGTQYFHPTQSITLWGIR